MKQFILLFLVAPLLTFGQWTQIGSDIDGEAAGDQSGFSVSLSSDGNIVAIGAWFNFFERGHVRVYENIAGVWTQIGSDIDGEVNDDQSGYFIALSNNGSILAIGARQNDGNGADSGHVRVFENIAGVWTQIGSDIDGEAAGDLSGTNVSLNSDGSVLAIGAFLNDGNGSDSGHVRVFENIAGVWTQIGSDIDGEHTSSWSGFSTNLSSDGTILAIGASFNSGVNGVSSGHVRVFENIAGVWTQIGSDIDGEVAGDRSGIVSLSSDGNVVAIGSTLNDDSGTDAGHVRVYQNIGGVWTQIGSDIDGEAAGDNSGIAVSLSDDGTILAIGAWSNDGNGTDSGHVRVYQNIAGVWTQVSSDIDGEAASDLFGRALSLSSDGSTLAVGAFWNSGNGFKSGHVRVFNNASLSITTNTFGHQFKAQPNPSFGSTNIELGGFYQEIEISIYDLLGKEMMREKYNNTNKIILDTQQFTTGVYIINVEASTNKASLKLVVN